MAMVYKSSGLSRMAYLLSGRQYYKKKLILYFFFHFFVHTEFTFVVLYNDCIKFLMTLLLYYFSIKNIKIIKFYF